MYSAGGAHPAREAFFSRIFCLVSSRIFSRSLAIRPSISATGMRG